jgi:hypothetical protein
LTQLVTSWGVPNVSGDYAIILNSATATVFSAEARPTTARQTPDGICSNQNGTKTADKWAKELLNRILRVLRGKIVDLSCFFCLKIIINGQGVYRRTMKGD